MITALLVFALGWLALPPPAVVAELPAVRIMTREELLFRRRERRLHRRLRKQERRFIDQFGKGNRE
jgi:hypothetical protein